MLPDSFPCFRVRTNDVSADSCFYYSTASGGSVEDDHCSSASYHVACIATCEGNFKSACESGKKILFGDIKIPSPMFVSTLPVITCPSYYPHAYDGGAACCDAKTRCDGGYLTRTHICCSGESVHCRSGAYRECYDAGKTSVG